MRVRGAARRCQGITRACSRHLSRGNTGSVDLFMNHSVTLHPAGATSAHRNGAATYMYPRAAVATVDSTRISRMRLRTDNAPSRSRTPQHHAKSAICVQTSGNTNSKEGKSEFNSSGILRTEALNSPADRVEAATPPTAASADSSTTESRRDRQIFGRAVCSTTTHFKFECEHALHILIVRDRLYCLYNSILTCVRVPMWSDHISLILDLFEVHSD